MYRVTIYQTSNFYGVWVKKYCKNYWIDKKCRIKKHEYTEVDC